MAVETREVEIVTCDGCGKRQIVDTEIGIAKGYDGTIHLADDSGRCYLGEWFACKPAHIAKAVRAVITVWQAREAGE